MHERQLNHGLFSSYTTDEEARLNRLYYVVDGAAETLKRASGFSIALFDTTHSTIQYYMRLGCFTTRNEDGRTILLAVSLVKNEDTRSFAWVFGKFKESFASEPDVLLLRTATPPWLPRRKAFSRERAISSAPGIFRRNC